MGSQFSIPFLLNLCSESVEAQNFEILFEDSDSGGPSLNTVMMDYLFASQFWYCELCVENRWEGGRKHCFVNFCSLAVLYSSVGEGLWEWGRKPYLGPAKIAPFSRRDFSRSNKHDTFWYVVSTGYFYVLFLWAIAVSDFRTLEIYKYLSSPLSTITFTGNSQPRR